MLRPIAPFALLLTLVALAPRIAEAQVITPIEPDAETASETPPEAAPEPAVDAALAAAPIAAPPTLSAEDRNELEAIHGESSLATALYIVGVTTHVVGAVALGISLIWAISTISFTGTSGDNTGPTVLGAIGGVLFGGGLITLFTGVGFDVDAGHRRNALRERNPGVDFTLAPLPNGGGYGTLSLAF